MLILKSRSLSSRWYKATSCNLARSNSDRLWMGTGCNRTLCPNMVAHVWSPCRANRDITVDWRRPLGVSFIIHKDDFLFYNKCPYLSWHFNQQINSNPVCCNQWTFTNWPTTKDLMAKEPSVQDKQEFNSCLPIRSKHVSKLIKSKVLLFRWKKQQGIFYVCVNLCRSLVMCLFLSFPCLAPIVMKYLSVDLGLRIMTGLFKLLSSDTTYSKSVASAHNEASWHCNKVNMLTFYTNGLWRGNIIVLIKNWMFISFSVCLIYLIVFQTYFSFSFLKPLKCLKLIKGTSPICRLRLKKKIYKQSWRGFWIWLHLIS